MSAAQVVAQQQVWPRGLLQSHMEATAQAPCESPLHAAASFPLFFRTDDSPPRKEPPLVADRRMGF
ncbi:hypothetical protein WJ58_09830 [Burkholderia ubonensis]|nr:hypothetical protein WJ58_09830 [Burkholderia ubonensis]